MSSDENEKGLRLAEMLCARLCHDLAGPVGGVMAGAEFLADAEGEAEALAVLRSSATAVSARLKFLRAVFGPPQSTMKLHQLCSLASAFLGTSPGYELKWDIAFDEEEVLEGNLARTLLLMIFLARDCLPRGGKICIFSKQTAPLCLSVRAEGTWNGAIVEEMKALDGEKVELSARTAPLFLLGSLASGMDGDIKLETFSAYLTLTIGK